MKSVQHIFGAAAILMLSGCASTAQTDQGAAQPAADMASGDALKTWVDARAGTGAPVHWIADGGVYEYPSGKKLFGMIGFDSSKVIWPDEEGGPILHLTRKTFAYTDAETGEILTEYNGQPVEPIAYPYQLITYRYENDRIYGDVTQGTGDRVRDIKATDGVRATPMGDTWAYTASVWLDFPLPSGEQYQAWENYDFFIHPEGSVEEPHQMSWQRYGKLPAWAGGGQAIYHLLSWRVESHDEFPPELLAWAQENKPQWLSPPQDLAEIEAIQREDSGTGFSD